jgi:4a-hydroxytetrahydrobiopterin dehydratase
MVEALSSEQFHQSPGVEEWHVTATIASASFITDSFARGVKFVNIVGALADAANHHPDVDLRYPFVVIRLTTHEIHALSERDATLAREISAAARELGITADPAQ